MTIDLLFGGEDVEGKVSAIAAVLRKINPTLGEKESVYLSRAMMAKQEAFDSLPQLNREALISASIETMIQHGIPALETLQEMWVKIAAQHAK